MRASGFRGAQNPRYTPVAPTGYEPLEPKYSKDATAAHEAFKADVLPTLSEVHGGELAIGDPEYTRGWLLFLRGWNAAHLYQTVARCAEENGRCP